MGWNDTFDNSTDWSAQAFQHMFWNAACERSEAPGTLSPITVRPAVGADVSYGGTASPASSTGSFSARRLQDWVQINYNRFSKAPIPAPSGDEMAGSGGGSWANLSEFMAAASIPGFAPNNFWTRKHRSGGSVVSTTGPQQPGDFIGPWIWNELRNAFNLMFFSGAVPAVTSIVGYSVSGKNGQTDGSADSTDLADVKAVAEANFNASPVTGSSSGFVWSRALIQQNSGPPVTYNGVLNAAITNHTFTSLPSVPVVWRVYVYAKGSSPGAGFDDNGVGLVSGWQLWREESMAAGAASSGPHQLGTLAVPNWPASAGEGGYLISRMYSIREFLFTQRAGV